MIQFIKEFKQRVDQFVNEFIMMLTFFDKNLFEISTKIQRHSNLFHAMHNFLKRTLFKSRSSENDQSLIEKSSFVAETNRINFKFCEENKER